MIVGSFAANSAADDPRSDFTLGGAEPRRVGSRVMSTRALTPAYPIETARLLLRPIDPVSDVDALHAYRSLPEVCRYIPYEPRTRDEVAARLADPARVRSTLTEPGQAIKPRG